MDNSDRSDLKLLNGHPGVLFLVATHTDEKSYHFSVIARDISRKHNIPLAVEPLKKLYLHSSPLENGIGSKGNARIKHAASEHARHELRDPTTEMHKAMQKVMAANGIAYDQNNVIIFSEDSVVGIPADIWPRFRDLLAPDINPGLLANTQPYTRHGEEREIDGVKYTMLIDYGMMKEALANGTYEFYDKLRQAALESGYARNQPVPMIDEVSCYWSRLSDPVGSPERPKVRAAVPVFLYAPKGLDRPLDRPGDGFVSSRHFECTPDKPHEAISDRFFYHMRAASFRRLIFEKLLADTTLAAPISWNFKANSRAISTRGLRDPFIVQVTPGQHPSLHRNIAIARHIPENFEKTAGLLAMEFPDGPKGNPRTADVIIVPPYTPENLEERLRFLTTVTSMMVARQIDPRYGRPVAMIALNHNGCHDWWLNLSHRLTDAGFNGNYVRDLRHERGCRKPVVDVAGVTLRSDRYFHVLNGMDEAGLGKASRQLVRACLQNFTRSPHRPAPDSIGEANAAKPADMFGAVAFMTANHEGRSQAQIASDIGAMLAKNGFAAGWGGMNKAPGLQFMEGYKNNGGAYLFASTTNDLVRTETSKGELPSGLDAWAIRRTIASRALDLVTFGDAFLSRTGGVGTVQEDGLALLAGKPLVFVVPELKGVVADPWEYSVKALEMRCLLGADAVNRMMRSHDVCADKNVLLATSVEEAKDYLRALQKAQASRPANDHVLAPSCLLRRNGAL